MFMEILHIPKRRSPLTWRNYITLKGHEAVLDRLKTGLELSHGRVLRPSRHDGLVRCEPHTEPCEVCTGSDGPEKNRGNRGGYHRPSVRNFRILSVPRMSAPHATARDWPSSSTSMPAGSVGNFPTHAAYFPAPVRRIATTSTGSAGGTAAAGFDDSGEGFAMCGTQTQLSCKSKETA